MSRASADDVRALIEIDSSIDVEPFIRLATRTVDRINTNDTDNELNAADLKEIETLLAAHYASFRDQQYSQKKTGDASGVFMGKTGMGLDYSPWGQMAKELDVTGTLENKRASLSWGGKAKSDQIDYVDRD